MKTKILIAEQNPAAIEWIQHELKTGIINCIVEIVSSKKAYEAALHHFKPDLILSNDTFPSFDGMALFRMKQKLTPQTPFIFVVPAITVEKAIALIQIGVNDIVFKTDLNSLTSKVNSALKKSRKTRETYQTEAERTIMPRYSITESKTAKEKSDPIAASQESLQDLGKILDFSMDLICSCDENGKFIWVNKASERILGYRPEELIGRLYIDLLFPEDAETSVHTDFDSSNGGQLPIFENRFRHSNGSTVYLQWSAVWDDAKKMSYYTGRDITAKKNVEKAFEIERRRFSNLFSHAPSSMAILKGPNHVFELANELYLQLIDTKDIIGKTVKEVLPELETQGIFEILDTVYKTGETFSANEMLIEFNRSGNEKPEDSYLNFICQAHRDTDNNIDGILVFANDVTEQVLSRKKIEEREKMYKELIYKLPVATYSCDHKGRIVIYNKAAVALWGRKPEIGKDLWYDSWKSNAAKNNPEPLSFCSLSKALTEEDSNPSKQIIIERPNGDKRYVLPYPVPFRDAEGRITGAVIVLADITEMKLAQKDLKKSEKKYRYLFDNNPMPMWVIDLVTFKFLDVNKMAILQYGYSRDEFLSMTALDIRPSKERNHFIKSSDTSEIKRSNYNRGKWNHLRKDGSVFPVEIIAHDIMYEGSRARLILSNDISDQTKAGINLEKRNKELLKTNSELDKFVYSVSHDLRSPLTSILGLLSFIETESREPDTVIHAEMIHSSINRLDDFIKNILSYSRNKRTGLEVEKISINETLSEVVNSLQRTRDARGVHYEIAVQEQQPFYTDRLRFNTILENLISNAIKYQKKEESGRSVKIAGHSDPENLHLTITDNGIGIAPAYHQKIYDMFFRLSGKKEGSGIGLYIVKDAIEILQGSIAIQSEEGIGTTFIITLKNLKP